MGRDNSESADYSGMNYSEDQHSDSGSSGKDYGLAIQSGHADPFYTMEMVARTAEREAEKHDTVPLCIGQPSTPAPRVVRDVAIEAIEKDKLGYTEALGIQPLRERIARWHSETYGTDTKADNVIVTTGSSGAFVAIFAACLPFGGTVALSSPGYAAYRNVLQALGNSFIDIPTTAETRFHMTRKHLDDLAQAGNKPDMVLITSPNNPTGSIIDPDELRAISQWCDETDTVLVSDEIYHGISYGRPTVTARSLSDRAVVIGSTSKYFSMTGWRLGWLIIPDDPTLRETIENILGNISLCAPALSQIAATRVFDDDALAELRVHVERYKENHDILNKELPAVGLPRFAPSDGAFYFWVDVSDYTDDSVAFAHELLDATGVSVSPGTDFDGSADKALGKKYVRVSYAGTPEEMREACRRLKPFLEARRR